MSDLWYYRHGNESHGPITGKQLQQLVGSKQLDPGDLAWQEGMAQWLPISQLLGAIRAAAKQRQAAASKRELRDRLPLLCFRPFPSSQPASLCLRRFRSPNPPRPNTMHQEPYYRLFRFPSPLRLPAKQPYRLPSRSRHRRSGRDQYFPLSHFKPLLTPPLPKQFLRINDSSRHRLSDGPICRKGREAPHTEEKKDKPAYLGCHWCSGCVCCTWDYWGDCWRIIG